MGYHVRFEGTLAINPALEKRAADELRAALGDSVWELSALGTILECRDTLDWDGAVDEIRWLISERSLKLFGELKVMGEDDQHLGDVSVKGEEVHVVDHEVADEGPTIAELAELLAGGSDDQRRYAAEALCAYDEPETIAALQGALDDRLSGVRQAALESLGELGPSSAPVLRPVMALLDDPDPVTRYWATYALGRMGPAAAEALPRLERMTAEVEHGPKFGAIDALSRIRG